jgi:hypothetical protein
MNPENVKTALIEVLQEIQCDSGFGVTPMSGKTCPISDIEGFDSPLWLDAIGMLAEKLGVNIPFSNNIFLSEDGQRQLTIDESVAVVCKVFQKGESRV